MWTGIPISGAPKDILLKNGMLIEAGLKRGMCFELYIQFVCVGCWVLYVVINKDKVAS